jgi:hypothetical protein
MDSGPHTWELSWFEKNGDALIGDLELPMLSDADASRIVNFDFSEGLGAEFPLDELVARRLRDLTGIEVDLVRWDYFLGARALPG